MVSINVSNDESAENKEKTRKLLKEANLFMDKAAEELGLAMVRLGSEVRKKMKKERTPLDMPKG